MTSPPRIEPKILKGFRDTLPDLAFVRQRMIRDFEEVFLSFGYMPIDTPALEYAEILLGKGSAETDKQLYRFTDNGERDIALRFDLTVPLARFSAMHIGDLGTPFRRYHIAPVWRAEKPQRGRYREFIQCDFDIIGVRSESADAETACIIYTALSRVGIAHQVRVNNRRILSGLLEQIGARDRTTVVLRAIDKLDKVGREGVERELRDEAQLGSAECERLFAFLDLRATDPAHLLAELGRIFEGNELAAEGVRSLRAVVENTSAYGVPPEALSIDLSIARGLDYYTGTVFETVFTDLPAIGSICSGGRYDNLASLYTPRKLPGVGASIGLDRILGALEELDRLEKRGSPADVLLTLLDDSVVPRIFDLAGRLRRSGLRVEIFPDVEALGGQLKYAARKGIQWAVILGEREKASGTCGVKELASGTQEVVPVEGLTQYLTHRITTPNSSLRR